MARRKSDTTKEKYDGILFGQRLRHIRIEKKISIQKLADNVGVLRNYISQLEKGDRVPSFDILISLANALGVTTDELTRDYLNASLRTSVRSELIAAKLEELTEPEQLHLETLMMTEIQFLKENRI